MKNILIYLLGVILIFTACNKLELPSETDKDTDKDKPVNPIVPPDTDDTLSVAQALTLTEENIVLIKGYMVGYVRGTSIKTGASFDLPDYENTNFLIADKPYETNSEKCMAVKLEKTGKFEAREELNLLDHPEFLHKGVILEAILSKYFGRNGLIRIFSCEIFENNEENAGGDDSSSDHDDNGDNNNNHNPDNEGNENSDKPIDSDTLAIDNNEQFIPDGRNFKK